MKIYTHLALVSIIARSSAFTVSAPSFAKVSTVKHRTLFSSPDESNGSEVDKEIDQEIEDSFEAEVETKIEADIENEELDAIEPEESASSSSSSISTRKMWNTLNTIRVQGGTLKTCSFDTNVNRVEVFMKTNGRPLHGDVELWQGHCNTPQKMKVYLEDGSERSFRVVVETPGSSNSISIRNTANQEYPITAGIEADTGGADSARSPAGILSGIGTSRIVQGGAVYTLPFSAAVQSLQVMISSDGRPMNAKLELLQGPNNVKQSMEIYCEDGSLRPLYVIMDSPGNGNQIRIVNTSTIEYPVNVCIEPYIVDESLVDGGTKWT